MMRNALFCAGAMLAMLLLWPLIFGGPAGAEPVPARSASTVVMAIPDARPARATLVAPAGIASSPAATCSQRHTQHARLCAPSDTACRSRTFDALDICEATGFWPA